MEPCCRIEAGPYCIEVPMPQDTPDSEGKPKARDWSGFAQAVIAILQALSQILGPFINPPAESPHGQQRTPPAGAPGQKPR